MLDLPGHDRTLHALALEEANHTPKLPDADPQDALRHALNRGVCLLTNRRDRQRHASLARSFEHEKRKTSVACDQSVMHKAVIKSLPVKTSNIDSKVKFWEEHCRIERDAGCDGLFNFFEEIF